MAKANWKPYLILASVTFPLMLHVLDVQAQSGSVFSVPSSRPLSPPSSTSTQSAPLAKFEPPGNRVYHGASLPDTWTESGLRAQVQGYQRVAGKRISVVTWFASAYEQGRLSSWRNNYALPLTRVRKAGAVSLIKFSVQDYAFAKTGRIASTRDIARGVYDAYFEEAADAVRDFKDPVFISINHEMNGTWYPFSEAYPGSNVTAQDYIAAWRRIVDVFRRKGANNAAFVWAPNVPDVGPVPYTSYYPGDDYVDWVGVSFYSGNPLSNLQQIYRTYAAKKPIFITEWATGEDKNQYYAGFPGDAQWIEQFFTSLEKNYPRVKAISWFQWDKRQQGESNYQLQRVPEQAQSYNAQIQDPRYVDAAEGILLGPRPSVETPPLMVTPKEIVLNGTPPLERTPLEKPAVERPAIENPKPQRPRLRIIPRR
jgi:hypothetical protein